MRHAYMYNGAFELNYASLSPNTTTYKSTDGEELPLPKWPDKFDGIRVGYMEKAGKKFVAVRVQFQEHDVIIENPVHIDPLRHMGNQRFSSEAIVVADDDASALLDDIIRDNPDKQVEVAKMINRINQIRREGRAKGKA
ncbi:MAG TPA: hypothetical protein VK636_12595 [Gemmatimonadaceae bacterium]|nr:hypothetical protein [Gemmatimonadaceae bacterium]